MQNQFFIMVLLAAFSGLGGACTSVYVPSAKLMGKNYDWHREKALIVVNKQGMKKQAMVVRPQEVGAQWISKYGSVTFNQYGREFPNGGMNEAGLTIEILWLDASVYEPADSRPTVNELSWIQYQLDNYALTEEVVARIGDNRLSQVYAKVHYLVCDASGDCATVEWVGGKPQIHHGKNLPRPVITNDTYARSWAYAGKFAGFGGKQAIPSGSDSLSRFVRAAAGISRTTTMPELFQLLQSVRQGNTVWNIGYDIGARTITYQTRSHPTPHIVSFKDLSFGCGTPVWMLNIQAHPAVFQVYDEAANLKLIRENLSDIPQGAKLAAKMSAYPATTACE